MSKHTPGPWKVDDGLMWKGCIIADIGCGCGRLHTIAAAKVDCGIIDGSGNGNHCNPGKLPAEANAQLIAAAPELLERVHDYLSLFKTYVMQDMDEETLLGEVGPEIFKDVIDTRDAIIALIQKAEGKS